MSKTVSRDCFLNEHRTCSGHLSHDERDTETMCDCDCHPEESAIDEPVEATPAPDFIQSCAGCGGVLNLAYPYATIDPDGDGIPTHLSDSCFSKTLAKRRADCL